MSAKRAPTRAHIQPFCFPSTSRGTRTRTPNRATAFEAVVSAIPPHWPCKRSTVFYGALVPPAGLEPARPRGRRILSALCLPIPPQRQEKGERKQTRATTTQPQCAQPAGHTHTSRTTGQPNPRARTLSTGQPRPTQLTHQHREHPGANTQAPPAHTQRTTNAATHPSVTAPAAASTPALFPLPGRRSRT